MLWILTILFGILSVVFLLGKGSFLIAGYNTSSQNQKAQYDEKKLCRIMGIGCLVLTLSFLVIVLKESLARYVLPTGFILSLFIMFLGTRVASRKKVSGHQFSKSLIINLIVSVAIGVFVLVALFSGSVHITLNEKFLNADASMIASYDIYYENIDSISYKTNIDLGRRTGGFGNFRIQAGNFKNDEYGKYKLYSYVCCKDYVVLKLDQQYVVINDSNETKTKQLYNQIYNYISKR